MVRRIFLTGGTGFFGKSILDMLLRGFLPDASFTILSRDPEGFLRSNPQFGSLKNIRFIAGDVRDFAFPKERFDGVIHAATPAVTTLAPGEMRRIILDGTRHVLDFAAYCGANRLLFVSSGAVYGAMQPGMSRFAEDFLCRPVTEYGIAKLEAEKMCLDSGIGTVTARCFAFVGPYLNLDIHYAAGNFIRDGLNGEPITVKGDGTPFRSYLYADDLVEWLFAALERGVPGRAYNVGSPESLSIAELAREVARCFAPAPEVRSLTPPPVCAVPERYVPEVSRAQNELGVTVKFSLHEALRRTIAALRHR